MIILKGIETIRDRYKDVVLTIGNFDGVHIGHQKIFRNVVERSRATGGTSMAITFDPHPLKVIAPERGLRMLTTFGEKTRLIGLYGIDVLLCIDFDRDFAHMSADDFIRKVILEAVAAKAVIVGHNYAFGRGKRGTTALLRRRGRQLGFEFSVIRNARLYGHVVSSSRVRSLLTRGRVCEASRLLGRPYMIEGTVIKGAGRGGRLLGIPTANIASSSELIPKDGVYAVKVRIEGSMLEGVANIGKNPTFGGIQPSYEIHIFDFAGMILGKQMRVYFIDRIRDERTFPNPDALREHILRDIERAREILRSKKYPTVL